MRYMVTIALRDGKDCVLTVNAPDREEAKYRASYRAEQVYGPVSHVKHCRKA